MTRIDRLARIISFAITYVLLTTAAGQGAWDMRVCAPPHDMPGSSQAETGFDNQIAEILAEELNASLSYVWTTVDLQSVRDHVMTGQCDLVMGVADGAAGLSSTVAYYRSPYVFLQRSDASDPVRSLDDPILAALRIATYPNSGPHRALIQFGLAENVVDIAPVSSPGGPDYVAPIGRALREGVIDVALLHGPDAGWLTKSYPETFSLEPVAPEIVPPMFQMFRIATIGVRPGDESFRDGLNVALARRWDDIQSVLEQYGVPLQPVPRPSAPDSEIRGPRVGVILPLPTSVPRLTDDVGRAARQGALMGENLAAGLVGSERTSVDVVFADAPDAASAERAARRLVATEDVVALVGGLAPGQPSALSRVAEEENVLFLNLGSDVASVHEQCNTLAFRVGASPSLYLEALASNFRMDLTQTWIVVHDDSMEGRSLMAAAMASIESLGSTHSVDAIDLPAGSLIHYGAIDRIRSTSPDIVMVVLPVEAQEFFLAQYEAEGLQAPVALYPHPVTQSRAFLARLKQIAPEVSTTPRVALWEPTLSAPVASKLNDRFASTTGSPMDPSAWAAYASITILQQALIAVEAGGATELAAFLVHADVTFDVGKSLDPWFRESDRQLLQPLYIVEIDQSAEWGPRLGSRLALANLLEEFPSIDLGVEDRRSALAHTHGPTLSCPPETP